MKKERKRGLFAQVYIVTLIGVVTIGIFTYATQFPLAKRLVRSQTKTLATQAVKEVVSCIRDYPAYSWLISYWVEHAEELDIEYDAVYAGNTVTREKCDLFMERNPGLQIRYCSTDELEALDAEDQKLYAEIVYSWLITRIDGIKRNFDCNYLFVVLTDTDAGENPYGTQYFLMSGADPNSVRGTEYEQVYTLGVKVSNVPEGTQAAMREAVENATVAEDGTVTGKIVDEDTKRSGKYTDLYGVLEIREDTAVLVGVTLFHGEMLTRIRQSALWNSLIAMVYQLLLINLVMWRVFQYMLKPLKEVLEAIRSYTVSKDSKAIENDVNELLSQRNARAIRQNEIGQLTEDIVSLAQEIDVYTKQIETDAAAREHRKSEMETAARIQNHMLPEAHPVFPDHPEFELSASMTPAREVGGDFYDYFLIDDCHLAMVIADVSDKGVPAALFMAQAKELIKSKALTGEHPDQILMKVNNQLNEDDRAGCFVTVWLAVIDLRTGKGYAANAGHEHPALSQKGEPFELVIYKHNLVIGMIKDVKYSEHEFTLYPGDRLFVYTDGVPEASNSEGEQFGTDRMIEALNAEKNLPPKEVLDGVSAAVDEFVGDAPRFDDTTMMCLYYKGV